MGHFGADDHIGLVGKHAPDAGVSPEPLYIRSIAALDESPYGPWIHQVDPAGAVITRLPHRVDSANIEVMIVTEQNRIRRLNGRSERQPDQAAGPEIGLLPRNDAAGKAAGPFVLVVIPHVHIQSLQCLRADLHHPEPLLAEIRGQQADPAVQKRTAVTRLFHQRDLANQLGAVEAVVERIERHSPERVIGMLEQLLFERGINSTGLYFRRIAGAVSRSGGYRAGQGYETEKTSACHGYVVNGNFSFLAGCIRCGTGEMSRKNGFIQM